MRSLCFCFLTAFSLLIASCGGGGGKAGQCSGGDTTCNRGAKSSSGSGQSTTPPNNTSGASCPLPDVDTSFTCPQILNAVGGNTAQAYACAQVALSKGANKLDADKDGKGCDEYEPTQSFNVIDFIK